MNLIVLDTETSDLDPAKGGAMLELAWLKLVQIDTSWNPITSYESYIQYSGPISPGAQATHHINPNKLTAEAGAVLRETAIAYLNKHIEPDTILVAHNADFDFKYLPEIPNPWICTLRVARHLWPTAPSYSNQVLRYWLNIEPDQELIRNRYPHQAIYDVATTTGLLLRMLSDHTPQQLLALSNTVARLRIMPWGKHKGQQFNTLPRDYVEWLNRRPDLDDDMRNTVNHYLKSLL